MEAKQLRSISKSVTCDHLSRELMLGSQILHLMHPSYASYGKDSKAARNMSTVYRFLCSYKFCGIALIFQKASTARFRKAWSPFLEAIFN